MAYGMEDYYRAIYIQSENYSNEFFKLIYRTRFLFGFLPILCRLFYFI